MYYILVNTICYMVFTNMGPYLIVEVLGRSCAAQPVLFGKHAHKMALVGGSGVDCRPTEETSLPANAGRFDVVVEATGSPLGMQVR
jgi:hypothetical protein